MLGYDMVRDKQTLTLLGFSSSCLPREIACSYPILLFLLSSFFCFFSVSLSLLAGFAHFCDTAILRFNCPYPPPNQPFSVYPYILLFSFLFPEEFYFIFMSCIARIIIIVYLFDWDTCIFFFLSFLCYIIFSIHFFYSPVYMITI